MKKTLLFVFSFFISHFSFSQCPEALMRYAERYPAAEPTDLYKLVFQDLYGPGHLLTDSLAAVRYISREVAEVPSTTTSPASSGKPLPATPRTCAKNSSESIARASIQS